MDIKLLNKTINEITPETLVEWYNVAHQNLETIQNKLKNAKDYVWQQMNQMALSDDFIREFKQKWIGVRYQRTYLQMKVLLKSFRVL